MTVKLDQKSVFEKTPQEFSEQSASRCDDLLNNALKNGGFVSYLSADPVSPAQFSNAYADGVINDIYIDEASGKRAVYKRYVK
jgi:hypothetical protein